MAANLISTGRIALLPVVAWAILTGSPYAFWLFGLAALSDFADGFVARRFDQVTDLGKLLDAVADRLLTVVVVVSVYVAKGFPESWVMAVMLGRDALMGVGMLVLGSRRLRLDVVPASKVATAILFTAYSLIIYGIGQGRALFYAGFVVYLWVGLTYAYEGKKLLQASRRLPTDSRA